LSVVSALFLIGTADPSATTNLRLPYSRSTSLADDTYTLRFSLWDAGTEGTEQWWEQKDLDVEGSTISTQLGDVADPSLHSGPLGELDFSKVLWVQVEELKNNGKGLILVPRTTLIPTGTAATTSNSSIAAGSAPAVQNANTPAGPASVKTTSKATTNTTGAPTNGESVENSVPTLSPDGAALSGPSPTDLRTALTTSTNKGAKVAAASSFFSSIGKFISNIVSFVMDLVNSIFSSDNGPADSKGGQDSYGIVVHVPSTQLLDLAVKLGVQWVRITDIWSSDKNPCGTIQFDEELENAVKGAISRGLKVYLSLGVVPECASLGDKKGDGFMNDVPKADLWTSYVKQTVTHYRKLGVTHFGLHNEVNLEDFFEGSDKDAINNIFANGIPAIKAGCSAAGFSDCLALGPELSSQGSFDKHLKAILKGLQAKGVMFDIITHHIYNEPDREIWSGDAFLDVLEKQRFFWSRKSLVGVLEDVGLAPGNRPSKEIWITETGDRGTSSGSNEQQAQFYEDVLKIQKDRSWYTNTFFYQLANPTDLSSGFNIADPTGAGAYTLKPAFSTYQRWIQTH